MGKKEESENFYSVMAGLPSFEIMNMFVNISEKVRLCEVRKRISKGLKELKRRDNHERLKSVKRPKSY